MKHLFTKMMVIVAMLFAGSALMTACTPDNGDDYNGPPVLEIGEPNVINALKVEIPLNAKKLVEIGYKVVAEGENAPASAMMVFRSGSKVEGNTSMLTITGDDGLDLGKTFTVYIVATISATEFYNNGEMLTVQFTTPNEWRLTMVSCTFAFLAPGGTPVYVFIPYPWLKCAAGLSWQAV